MKPWMIAVAALALALATYVTFRGAIDEPAHAPPPSAPPERAPTAAPPRPSAARWLAEVARPEAGERAPAAAPEAAPAAPPPAPTPAEVRDRFDAVFTADAVDPSWSGGAADAISRGVQAVLPPGSAVRRLECRGSMCRIETSHGDADAFRDFARRAFLERDTRVSTAGFFASLLEEPAGGGPVVGVAYIAREGRELPGPDALFAAR